MRVPDWPKRLAAVVARHQALPSEYGVSDCYILPDDAVQAVTGETMYGATVRKYTTPTGAAKQLRKKGFKTVRDAFAAKFAEIPVSQAQRGDIGVVNRDGETCGGVFTVAGFMIRDTHGIGFIPITDVAAAFKVE
ncbi:hypothetical protein EV128_12245 [Rhizobium azibense]|nr:hypothetical protein EV128_12245 [Rhizobium azibense]